MPEKPEVGALMAFGAAQTGQLDKANDRIGAIFTIYDMCEAFTAKAQQEIQSPPKWWEFWK